LLPGEVFSLVAVCEKGKAEQAGFQSSLRSKAANARVLQRLKIGS
jgi:hypothetical protein